MSVSGGACSPEIFTYAVSNLVNNKLKASFPKPHNNWSVRVESRRKCGLAQTPRGVRWKQPKMTMAVNTQMSVFMILADFSTFLMCYFDRLLCATVPCSRLLFALLIGYSARSWIFQWMTRFAVAKLPSRMFTSVLIRAEAIHSNLIDRYFRVRCDSLQHWEEKKKRKIVYAPVLPFCEKYCFMWSVIDCTLGAQLSLLLACNIQICRKLENHNAFVRH